MKVISMVPEGFRSVLVALRKAEPNQVYYLAGGPLVGLSFEQPAETIQSIALGTLNILEACHMLDKQSKVYYAGSNECFGDTKALPVNEITTFHSQSPKSIRILVGR